MSIEKWISKNINKSNFENKNVFITGGNSGIGFELARHCAKLGSNIFLLCRNETKAKDAITSLQQEFPKCNIRFIKLDLASFSSIENAAKEIQKYDVDHFVNNAGVFRLPYSKTENDFEIVMGTNYLGTLYLSNLLLPYFQRLKHKVHMLYVSSLTTRYNKIDYKDFFMENRYKPMKIYARSKRAINNMFCYFEEKYANSNIVFDLSHPGGTYSPLIQKGYRKKAFHTIAKGFMKVAFHTPRKASLSMLYALNMDQNNTTGPRGIFEISGYPKKCNLPIDKDYQHCVEIGNKLIASK